MIESLFIITNNGGEVIIEKNWKSVNARNICTHFWDKAKTFDHFVDIPPVLRMSDDVFIVNVVENDLFLLAVISTEISPLYVIEFLHRVIDVFQDYFSSFKSNTIKDNFSTVYQLLEEMLDNGYPLTTEPNALKAMIAPPSTAGRIAAIVSGKSSVSETLPDGTMSAIPWRKMGVKYAQNEIYFDVVEEMNAIVDANGKMVTYEVTGKIMCNSRLSGVPDLTLIFVDPSVLDDCSFHPCVRYARYERDRVISFIPPDGQFELMQYRVIAAQSIMPISCQTALSFKDRNTPGCGALDIVVGTHPMPTLCTSGKTSSQGPVMEDISIEIPFPKAVRTVSVDATAGSGLFEETSKVHYAKR